jgi:hypothetical protein
MRQMFLGVKQHSDLSQCSLIRQAGPLLCRLPVPFATRQVVAPDREKPRVLALGTRVGLRRDSSKARDLREVPERKHARVS